jgi:hypothetical protein
VTDIVKVAIITGISVVAVGIITGASAILGSLVGGWRESKNQTRAWHRQQRRSAYADLLLGLDRFHEEADRVHFSNERRLVPRGEDALYHQTVALARLAMIVRLVGSSGVQKPLDDLMNHCLTAVMPLVYKDPEGAAVLWDKAMADDFWDRYNQFMRAVRKDLGLEGDFAIPERPPVG